MVGEKDTRTAVRLKNAESCLCSSMHRREGSGCSDSIRGEAEDASAPAAGTRCRSGRPLGLTRGKRPDPQQFPIPLGHCRRRICFPLSFAH